MISCSVITTPGGIMRPLSLLPVQSGRSHQGKRKLQSRLNVCCCNEEMRQFSFGFLADVQYADKDNKQSSSMPERTKYYRDSRNKLAEALAALEARKSELQFVLHLGDIIDGNDSQETSLDDLASIIEVFKNGTSLPVHHILGNHCLSVPRPVLLEAFGLSEFYWSQPICDGWKLVVLDTNDIGLHSGHPQDAKQMEETKQFWESHPPENHFSVRPWNGGLSQSQMRWLEDEMTRASQHKEKVIVACHHPIGSGSARPTHMALNALDIEPILVQSGVVPLVLSGHDHPGGYTKLEHTHFLTAPGIVEVPPGSSAYGIVHMSSGEITIEGFGTVISRSFPY